MIRGLFFSLLISGVIVVAAARLLPPTELSSSAPSAGDVAVPAGSEFNAERPDTEPLLPSTEPRPGSIDPPAVTQPGTTAEPALDTSPATTPETGAPESELGAPASGAAAPEVDSGEPEVETMPGTPQPPQPAVDASPEAVAPLETPQTVEGTEPELAAPAGESAPVVEAADEPSATPGAVPEKPTVQPAETAPDAPVTAAAPADKPEAETAPTDLGSSAPLPSTPPLVVPDAPSEPGLVQPEIAGISPEAEADALPRIGASPETPEGATPEPALIRNAESFTASGNAPLFALVLIDRPDGPEPESLAEFPVPLAVALDPTVPGIGARMAAWRAAGIEVAVLTPLPKGATPADIEVAFQGFLDAVPQSVAVMDMPEALLQESRPRAVQVVQILAATGHGLITYDRGLNAGLQIARGRDVPAVTVFREFDDGSRDAPAIERSLDQGAFRAGQAGPVVLVGQSRPETIAAITEWAQGTRARTVSLAPVSAVLLAQ